MNLQILIQKYLFFGSFAFTIIMTEIISSRWIYVSQVSESQKNLFSRLFSTCFVD